MGKRINLANLATEQVLDAPLPRFVDPVAPTTVTVHQVALNPINPREHFGDLSDLESMRTVGQLQPCAVVRRAAFLAVYPEHEPAIGDVEYIVVAGSRRRAAAEQFGIATLAVTVLDQLAVSRAQFYAASVAENIDRKNFDVLEEARAVQRLVQESGSGTEAGEILGKTKGWVSQRLALLRLSAPMQDLLRAGELPVRDARRLAALAVEDQLPMWRQEREHAVRERFTAVNRPNVDDGRDHDPQADASRTTPRTEGRPKPGRVGFAADATVEQIADLLRGHLSSTDLRLLMEALSADPQAATQSIVIGLPR